jgi:hypothetical protein
MVVAKLLGEGRVSAGLVFTTDDDGRTAWLLASER